MGVVKLRYNENGMCELSLIEWIELQQQLGIKVVKAYDYGTSLITRQRKKLWKRLGLNEEEMKVLKIIYEKHLLYQKVLDIEADYESLRQEFEALKPFITNEEVKAYKERLKYLETQIRVAKMQFKRRVERIEHYRKALMNTFESFKPMHSLETVTVKSLLRPVLKELDLYLFTEMFRTLKLTKKQYQLVLRSYIEMLEFINDIILQKFFECVENGNCEQNWKLKAKALQKLVWAYPEHTLSAIDVIYDIKDAKPNSELIVRILSS